MATPAKTKTTTRQKTTSGRTTRGRSTSARGRQARTTGETTTAARTTADRGATVPVPVVTPHVKVYRFHVPTMGAAYVRDAGRTIATHTPPPERLAFYGGLGLAAAFGVIEWPVAAAVGLGMVLARRALGPGRAGRTRSTARSS